MNQWVGNSNGTTSFELNFGTITVPDEALDSAIIFSDITDYNSDTTGYHEYGTLHSTGYTTSDVSLNGNRPLNPLWRVVDIACYAA